MSKKNIFLVTVLVIIFVSAFTIGLSSMENITELTFNGIVNTEKLNIRQGPGMDYNIVGSLKYGDNVNVIGQINDWYIVQTIDNIIGVCNEKYINDMEENEKINEIFNLINTERKKVGIKELVINSKLNKLAQKKAEDMVSNKYFSHESPTLGTPFDMIENYGIEYMTAGENIAGYNNAIGVVDAWMKSEGHRDNILSNGYNHTGIGIAKSEEYGYIYVQLFIGR